MSRHRVPGLLAAAVLAGCVSASPDSFPPAATDTPPPSGTAAATSGPDPTASADPVASCPRGPLSVAEFLASDPRCYVSEDVAVAGWWGSRRGDEPGAETVFSWLVRGSLPFGSWNEGPEQLLFVDDLAAAPPEGWPDGIHWATITGRRGSSNDLACHVDRPIVGSAPLHCPAYLVASAVIESEPPDSALAACAAMPINDDGWVDVEAFTGYPPACFGARDMTVRGWFDIRYIIAGWEAPWGISPGWLWVPIGPWTVVSPSSNAESASALLVHIDPAGAVDASATNRWVLLTGHYSDRAAASCRIEYAGGYDPAVYDYRVPDSFARRECEAHFVATAIVDTTP